MNHVTCIEVLETLVLVHIIGGTLVLEPFSLGLRPLTSAMHLDFGLTKTLIHGLRYLIIVGCIMPLIFTFGPWLVLFLLV